MNQLPAIQQAAEHDSWQQKFRASLLLVGDELYHDRWCEKRALWYAFKRKL